MLIKMLPKAERGHLLDLARLLAIADKPLLWEGKTYKELTAKTDLEAMSIKEGEQERELIADLESSAGISGSFSHLSALGFSNSSLSAFGFNSSSANCVKDRLIEVLKNYPFIKMEEPATRVRAATTVLLELLEEKKYDLPSTPKIILFELLLVALRDGHVSDVEWALLKEFQQYHKLEDFIFDDLLEHAEALNQEISKTISIILE